MDVRVSEEKIDPLQQPLVEQGWKLQDSVDDIGVRITDLRRGYGWRSSRSRRK